MSSSINLKAQNEDLINHKVLEAYKILRGNFRSPSDDENVKNLLKSFSSENLLELLYLEDTNDSNLLHFISQNFNGIYKYFLNLCIKSLKEENLCNFLLKTNQNGEQAFELAPRKHFFCNFIAKKLRGASVKLLVGGFLSRTFVHLTDRKLNNFLHHLAKNFYTPAILGAFGEFCECSRDLSYVETAMKARNSYGETPLHLLIQLDHLPGMFKAILGAFGGKIFNIDDKWGCNIFHALCGVRRSIFEDILIDFYEEKRSDPETQLAYISAMNHGDFVERIPLHDYVLYRKTKLFKFLINTLTVAEMRKLFLIKDEDEKNIFQFMFEIYTDRPTCHRTVEFFDAFFAVCWENSSWIEEIFANGTQLRGILVAEETENSYFEQSLRAILNKKGIC